MGVDFVAKTFRLTIYTAQDLTNPTTAQAMWQTLDNPLIQPQRFDSVERARQVYDGNDPEAACKIYSREGMLFVRGAKESFTAMFMRTNDPLSLWTFWWDVKAMSDKKRDPWLTWIYGLCRALPPYFGSGCSTEEHDAKHLVVKGSATGAVGVSIAEFRKFLPGLYWLTLFGPEVCEHFGSVLESLPHTSFVRPATEQLALLLDGPVLPQNMEERLRTEAELSDLLRANYFFDRNRKGIKFAQVPELAAALRRKRS